MPATICCRSARRFAPMPRAASASSATRRRSKLATSRLARKPRRSPRSSQARASWSSARRARPASSTARSRRATSPRPPRPADSLIERRQVRLDRAIKEIGLHEILITLHPEVEVPITMNVARSPDEAERQARGEDLTRPDVLLTEDELDADGSRGNRRRRRQRRAKPSPRRTRPNSRRHVCSALLQRGAAAPLFRFATPSATSCFLRRQRKQVLNGTVRVLGGRSKEL